MQSAVQSSQNTAEVIFGIGTEEIPTNSLQRHFYINIFAYFRNEFSTVALHDWTFLYTQFLL